MVYKDLTWPRSQAKSVLWNVFNWTLLSQWLRISTSRYVLLWWIIGTPVAATVPDSTKLLQALVFSSPPWFTLRCGTFRGSSCVIPFVTPFRPLSRNHLGFRIGCRAGFVRRGEQVVHIKECPSTPVVAGRICLVIFISVVIRPLCLVVCLINHGFPCNCVVWS